MIGLIILGVMLLSGAYKLWSKGRQGRKAEGRGPSGGDARTAVEQGFVPADLLDTENRAPVSADQQAAVAAAKSGDWQTCAAWVDAAAADWDERIRRVQVLSELAAVEDDWLLAWRAARPQDPTAAVVHADAAVQVAWNVRGSLSASRTTQEQFRVFHQLIAQAQEAAHEAQRIADPADPVPYMVEQPIAMALGYSHERYRELWAQIAKRDPKVLSAHVGALQYWCRKWRGSHEEARAFARESAAAGAPGDLLTLLPLYAHLEQEMATQDADPDVYYKQPEVVAAADAALADLAAARPDDQRAGRLRHMLAWVLYWQDRYEEALEQFRAVDGYIGATPWTYVADSKARYLKARDFCVRQVAKKA
ncbi:hypothetical protein [Streptomyces sp. ISL-94]|uniref:hypothetical protein n=1 Tax=Streptomyces sp. ISL-94 TaxID=2819190 RepID=UPI001BE9453E|nr:hypothetical protein [Streptomyces sp. ISL-94]MBT2480389.1 hypothetical protein [Streptomyces sp. ISL-94]